MLSRRDILSLLVVVIMLVGIPIVITLLRDQQIIRSRAAITPIKFGTKNTKLIADAQGNQKLIATKQDVELELTSTLELLATPRPSSASSPTLSPTSNPTTNPTTNPTLSPAGRSPSVAIWAGDAGAKSNIADNENLVINFNRNGDVNAVNLVIDGAEEGVPTQVIVPLQAGATQITWPNTHAKHTVGSHTVGIRGYFCPNVGTADPCTASSGTDTRSVTVTASGSQPVAGRGVTPEYCKKVAGDRVECKAQPVGSTTRVDVYIIKDGVDRGSFTILNADNSWTNSEPWSFGSGGFTARFIPIDGSGSGPEVTANYSY